MSDDVFSERGIRPRARRDDGAPVSEPRPAEPAPPPRDADAGALLREIRQGVRATVDEWLAERSHTISLAVTQVVEDAMTRLEGLHSARVRELAAGYEERIASAERERAEALRGAMRRRRARVRAVERELRERIERLERALTDASIEAVERMREVERQHVERRMELERAHQQALEAKDAEIAKLKGGSPDDGFDALADQLRNRRTM